MATKHWNEASLTTISNCFKQTYILKGNFEPDLNDGYVQLQKLIKQNDGHVMDLFE